jgi:hypothetical protein
VEREDDASKTNRVSRNASDRKLNIEKLVVKEEDEWKRGGGGASERWLLSDKVVSDATDPSESVSTHGLDKVTMPRARSSERGEQATSESGKNSRKRARN